MQELRPCHGGCATAQPLRGTRGQFLGELRVQPHATPHCCWAPAPEAGTHLHAQTLPGVTPALLVVAPNWEHPAAFCSQGLSSEPSAPWTPRSNEKEQTTHSPGWILRASCRMKKTKVRTVWLSPLIRQRYREDVDRWSSGLRVGGGGDTRGKYGQCFGVTQWFWVLTGVVVMQIYAVLNL